MHDGTPPPGDILRRKEEHIVLALEDAERRLDSMQSGFGRIQFVHCALPEARLGDENLTTSFLGKTLQVPLLIGSMTGGPKEAGKINRHLAEAANELGLAMGVGSQRISLEKQGTSGLGRALREFAPDILLLGNIGGVQLATDVGISFARHAVEEIGADALFVHLNPLQEALQPNGDTDWRGVLKAIETLCQQSTFPVIAKEVGCGISAQTARKLANAGVAAIDVAGAGGTSWAWIESQRRTSAEAEFYAKAFADWGISTIDAIREVRAECPDIPLIGSGGITNGVDMAKAIHVGADIVSIAGGVLPAARESTEAVVNYLSHVIRQLQITCFVTGCASPVELRHVRTIETTY